MQQHALSLTMLRLNEDPSPPNSTIAMGYGRHGGVIVGSDTSSASVEHAFFWEGGSPKDLGVLHKGTMSRSMGVSADGSVIIGDSWNDSKWRHAFRCEPPGPMMAIGELPNAQGSTAFASSSDGNIIVGSCWKGEEVSPDWIHAFVWKFDEKPEMLDLKLLPGASGSEALWVSEDGHVVIGRSWYKNEWIRTFRWTGGAMQDIGHF